MIIISYLIIISYYICSIIWTILIGVFTSSILLFSNSLDSSNNNNSSSTKSIVSSRKLEALSLIIPTSGVVVLNQFILIPIIDNSINSYDILGIQWYWIVNFNDLFISNKFSIGDLINIHSYNIIVFNSAENSILTSSIDVIHAIALPYLNIKLDSIPGRLVSTKISIELSGLYSGQCSELCGAMHSFMPISFIIVFI